MSELDQPAAAESAAEEPSPAQTLYDRMLATDASYKALARRLEAVKSSIAPCKVVAAPAVFRRAVKPATFVEGMHLLLDELDRTHAAISDSIEDLASLF